MKLKYVGRTFFIILILMGFGFLTHLYFSWQVLSQADNYLQRAEEYLVNGNPSAAARELKTLLKYDAEHAQANLMLGQCNYLQKNHASAIDIFSSIQEQAQEYRAASIGLIRCYLATAQMQQAEVQLKKHLKIYPAEDYALTELQWLFFNQLRERELSDHLNRAYKISGDKAKWLYHLVKSEHNRPIPQELVSLLQRIDKAAPEQPSIVLALTRCYWKMGKTEEARVYLKHALEMRPEHLETILVAVTFHLELADLQTAEQMLNSLAHSNKMQDAVHGEDRFYWLKSRIAFRNQDYQTAHDAINRALELRPYQMPYMQLLSKILRVQGKHTESENITKAIRKMATSDEKLNEIVAAGKLEQLNPDLCEQIAIHRAVLGKKKQAQGWQKLAQSMRMFNSSSAPQP